MTLLAGFNNIDHQLYYWLIGYNTGPLAPVPFRDHYDTQSSPKNHKLVYELFDDLSAFSTTTDMWLLRLWWILYSDKLNLFLYPGHSDSLINSLWKSGNVAHNPSTYNSPIILYHFSHVSFLWFLLLLKKLKKLVLFFVFGLISLQRGRAISHHL